MIDAALIKACTPPNVATQTVRAIIAVESGGNPYALHINWQTGDATVVLAPTRRAAETSAADAISHGASVDIGLMQINNKNLHAIGKSLHQILDPCTNIKAGAQLLSEYYQGAAHQIAPGQEALAAALSAYNTGNYQTGFSNGYVALYYGHNQFNGHGPPAAVVRINPLNAPTNVYRSQTDAPISERVTGQWPSQVSN